MAPSAGSSTPSGSFARRERHALCDQVLTVGPDAPTLCDGWTALDLVVHLLVRERKPWAAGEIPVPGLRGLAERTSAALRREPFHALVGRLRTPPPPLRPARIEALVNTVEFFVHHEDVRRARPGWSVRPLAAADEAALWGPLRLIGRGLVRPAGVPVEIVSGSRRAVLRRGDDPVVLSGPVGELAMFLFGRAELSGLSFDGPDDRIAALQGAKLGF